MQVQVPNAQWVHPLFCAEIFLVLTVNIMKTFSPFRHSKVRLNIFIYSTNIHRRFDCANHETWCKSHLHSWLSSIVQHPTAGMWYCACTNPFGPSDFHISNWFAETDSLLVACLGRWCASLWACVVLLGLTFGLWGPLPPAWRTSTLSSEHQFTMQDIGAWR